MENNDNDSEQLIDAGLQAHCKDAEVAARVLLIAGLISAIGILGYMFIDDSRDMTILFPPCGSLFITSFLMEAFSLSQGGKSPLVKRILHQK